MMEIMIAFTQGYDCGKKVVPRGKLIIESCLSEPMRE